MGDRGRKRGGGGERGSRIKYGEGYVGEAQMARRMSGNMQQPGWRVGEISRRSQRLEMGEAPRTQCR